MNAAIDALGYSVNQAARNLARGRTGSIAFVISEREERLFEDPNFGLFVRVFSRQLRQNGRHLLMTTAQDEEEENFLGDYLTVGHVDGALLALTHDQEPLLGPAAAEPAPAGRAGQAARVRGRVLLGGDRRREGGVHGRELPGRPGRRPDRHGDRAQLQTSSGRDRLDGYRRAIGDQFRPELVAAGDWSLRSGREGAEQLLARQPGLRGLFVASDLMAVGAIGALRDGRAADSGGRGRGRLRQLGGGHHGRAGPDHHAQPDRADRP